MSSARRSILTSFYERTPLRKIPLVEVKPGDVETGDDGSWAVYRSVEPVPDSNSNVMDVILDVAQGERREIGVLHTWTANTIIRIDGRECYLIKEEDEL
jgi:hypothetical protein